MKVLSLGWGIQSFTLAAMSALGEVEKVDFAIHADTLHERSDTYAFAKKYTPWLAERGVDVVTVTNPIPFEEVIKKPGQTHVPAFTLSPSGKKGMLRRSCTQRWKIAPKRSYLQSVRDGKSIEQWLGISTDEAIRLKESDVKYVTNRWPLIELDMSRIDCVEWLKDHNIEVPPRSSCIFCPYHDTNEWRDLLNNGNGDFDKAIRYDRDLRELRSPYNLFFHPARIPLEDVDFRTEVEKGQMTLWDEECEGICGV